MESWKTWGAMLTLLAASVLACIAPAATDADEDEPPAREYPEVELYNLDQPETDGGPLNRDSCQDNGIVPEQRFCVRDGDRAIFWCTASGQLEGDPCTRAHTDDPEKWCYGARDSVEASCVAPSEFDGQLDPGLEPGSDLWKVRYEAWRIQMVKDRIEDEGNGDSSSCCKTCRSSKACGDSCISKSKTCNVGRGCACNG